MPVMDQILALGRLFIATIVIILAFLALFLDKVDLAGLLAITGPAVGFYFGQYVKTPRDSSEEVAR